MKINLQFLRTNPHSLWREQVEKQMHRLGAMASITTASVALEREGVAKPVFRIHALLAVPGPDIHAEAREHTFQAALLKVVRELLRQLQTRKSKQLRKRHRHGVRNWAGTLLGQGA